jgi:hypothetical protein
MERISMHAGVSGGFTRDDLVFALQRFANAGYTVELIDLKQFAPVVTQPIESAWLLIVRSGLDALCSNSLQDEMAELEWDTKAWMHGRIVNKRARHNLCFDTVGHEPDYENRKGRVVAYDQCPRLAEVRAALPDWFGPKAAGLVVEGNLYYDITKCGIGFHGDTERKRVIGIRLGASMSLEFEWYVQSGRVGTPYSVVLNDGDIYCMSEKAVGSDWHTRTQYTLRHAANSAAMK